MSMSRPKQPDLLRDRILLAANEVLLVEGFARLTQERVLAKVGISKGGLQHHFRTKQHLLDGLFDQLFDVFALQYATELEAEPEGRARYVRAYVRASLVNVLDGGHDGRALVLLAINSPRYQVRWNALLASLLAPDTLDQGTLLACRLFADGLWISFVLGPGHERPVLDDALRIINQLTENPS